MFSHFLSRRENQLKLRRKRERERVPLRDQNVKPICQQQLQVENNSGILELLTESKKCRTVLHFSSLRPLVMLIDDFLQNHKDFWANISKQKISISKLKLEKLEKGNS